MIEALNEAVSRLKQDYAMTDTRTDAGMDLKVTGIVDTFRVSVDSDEITIYTDEWHEHVATAEDLEVFFRYLFTGMIRIVVTYRGSRPVGHSVEAIQDGEVRTISGTAEIWQPFWKRRRRVRLDYVVT